MKKRIIALLLIFAVSLPAFGCGKREANSSSGEKENTEKIETEENDALEETGAGEIQEEKENEGLEAISYSKFYYLDNEDYGDNYQVLYEGYVETIELSEENEASYPELAGALSDISSENFSTFEEGVSKQFEYARNEYEYNSEYFDKYEDRIDAYIRRADKNVFSYLTRHYSYTGGPHGGTMFDGYNFDTKTGELLSLSDVIKDKDKAEEILFKELSEDYPNLLLDDTGDMLKETLHEYFDSEYDPAFTVDPQGVSFYFGSYALGSYADGNQSEIILFGEYPEIFNEEYLPENRGYIVSLPEYDDMFFDLDGDGKRDRLKLYTGIHYDDDDYEYVDDSHKDIFIEINGFSYQVGEEWDSYGADMGLFLTDEGKSYAFVSLQQSNDYQTTDIFDVTDPLKKPSLTDSNGYTLPYSEKEGAELLYGGYLITDPDFMYLKEHFDRLATFSGTFHAALTNDGRVESKDDFYIYEGLSHLYEIELPVVTGFSAITVDENGNVLNRSYEVNEGDTLSLYRTGSVELEGEDTIFVDLFNESKDIVRIYYDESDYPHLVNGMNEELLFENLPYAG